MIFKNDRKILTFGCLTDHAYAIVRTRPRATHVVPAGTRLVTPGI